MTETRPRLIVVPTDFSETAAHALRYASSLALRLDACLLVVHGDLFISPIDVMGAAMYTMSREDMVTSARETMLQHAELNIDPRVPFDTRVIVAPPVNAILETVQESGAQLIVMGTHGRTGLRRLVVGSVTETVMRNATVPVIALNETSSERGGEIRKVLCPVTYTHSTANALRAAAHIVSNRRAPLVLVREVEGGDDPKTAADELMRLRRWIPIELVDRCELKIVPAQPTSESILALASAVQPDLIAIGEVADRHMGEVLRGTVAERVLQHSACAVLTVADPLIADKREKAIEIAGVY